ncbi:hypothetical protein D3C83_252410 [compost metagenome]
MNIAFGHGLAVQVGRVIVLDADALRQHQDVGPQGFQFPRHGLFRIEGHVANRDQSGRAQDDGE